MFFSKIEIEEKDDFRDIFAKVCEQIYSDKKFFRHAFEVKGQNGFWDEATAILTPYYMREAPSYDFLDDMKLFFVETDFVRLLRLIEHWIRTGLKVNVQKFSHSIRTYYYIYGTWTAQLASKQERMPLTENIFDDFEKHLDSFR